MQYLRQAARQPKHEAAGTVMHPRVMVAATTIRQTVPSASLDHRS